MGKEYSAEEIKALAPHVLRLSTLLTKERETMPSAYLSDPRLREAYTAYFLPANLRKIHLPLLELERHPAGLLKKERLEILDIGSGPGTAILGVMDFFVDRETETFLEFTAVDPVPENLRIAQELFVEALKAAPGRAGMSTIHSHLVCRGEPMCSPAFGQTHGSAPTMPRGKRFDMILLSNSLNEIARDNADRIGARVAVLEELLTGRMADDGCCIVIEPALRETSRELLQVRDLLMKDGFSVYSPCLCQSPCPTLEHPKDWCHEDIPWEPPMVIQELDRLTGLKKDSLKFSYLVIRKDGHRLDDLFPEGAWRVVSEPLPSKGKLELYVCGEGGRRIAMRLDRDKSAANAAFDGLMRGSLAIFGGVRNQGERFRVLKESVVRSV